MLSLEPTDDLAKPAFKDASSCTKWLSQLQLTNLNLAQGTLRKQVDELNRYAMRGNDRLQTLEALRETVAVVQRDFAKKLLGKKLPLADEEFTLLIALNSLWQSMLEGYLRCLQSASSGDKHLADKTVLLCHRSLFYGALQLEEAVHAGYEPDATSWQQFHELYAHVEQLRLETEPVRDSFVFGGLATSCRTLYAKTLLLHHARLMGLSRLQWKIADRWLCLWGDTLTIEPRCSMSKDDAPPLCLDLARPRGLQAIQHAQNLDTMRFLALVPLSKQIRVKTILLQQGQTPKQVELGDELPAKDCIDLLNRLHQYWCERHAESLADTPREASSLNMCIGLEKIYAHIARKPFKQLKDKGNSAKEAQRQIETFGRVLDETGQHDAKELGFAPEEWLVEEDGILRGRLLRLHKTGDRIAANHVISVFPPNTPAHKVGIIDMVRVAQHGQLYIHVHYLPGQPQSVVIRGDSGSELLQSGSAAALLLPAMENLRIPASLVVPRDWFQTGRTLELNLLDQSKQKVTLGFSVEKGSDFERVSFKPA